MCGGHSSCNASLSQSNVHKKQQSPCEGDGGLKFKKARKHSPHLRKKRAYFVIFHSQPNNIGPARQQPADWGSLNFSESGRRRKGGGGAQLLLISFATTILHEICNGSIKGMEDGGAHTPAPQPWDWG